MTESLSKAIDRLLASVTDGRAENTRFRQNQLHSLHAALKAQKTEICSAIISSSLSSSADAEAEYFLTLDAINQTYQTLDFEMARRQEFLITTGVNNATRKAAVGLVTVKPGNHSRLYSAIVPLAAAIAAGNCVLLELASASPIDETLLATLNNSLDSETFFASSTSISEDQIKQSNLTVNQQIECQHTLRSVGNSPLAPSIAIVERSADLKLAAKGILDARLFSNGTSPYGPDLVIVNEWVKQDFLTSCADYAKSTGGTAQSLPAETRKLIASIERDAKVHGDIPGLSILEIMDKNTEILARKLPGPVLLLRKSTSLVDTTFMLRNNSNILALYIFADPKSSKFLSEQITASVSYINQIPSQLLIGPASPSGYTHQLHPRYTPEMFQVSRPQIIEKVEDFEKVMRDLKPTGQKAGRAIGFFEQGILLGLGITAVVVLPSLGYAGSRILRVAWAFWKRG